MKKLLYLAAVASCLLLVSCKADSSTAPASSASETQTEAALTEMTSQSGETETTGTEFPRYSSDDGNYYYEINCPVVPAAEAGAAVTRLDFPSEIIGKTVQVDGFLDEETLIVQLNYEGENPSEIGTIPLKDGKAGEYQRLFELKQEQFASLLSERWLFISEPAETNNPFSNTSMISYRLYDLQKKKFLQPFYTAERRHGSIPPYTYGFNHTPLLAGDMLYFDDIVMENDEWNATTYGYDIARGKITETYPKCQQPILYQGQLIGRTKNDAGYDQRLISLKDNGESFRKDFSNLTDVKSGPDSLFAVIEAARDPVFDDDPDHGYLPVSKLLDLTSGQEIFTSNHFSLEDDALSVSGRLAGWNFVSPMRVALYDIREQRLISFDKIVRSVDDPNYFDDENYYRYADEYVSGNIALILLGKSNGDHLFHEALLVRMP